MQFIYGTGVETFLTRADELAANYGMGFSLDKRAREEIEKLRPW